MFSRASRQSQGFTLVEVLVVLSITAIISVLLVQMLMVMLRGHDQIGRIQSEFALDSMRNAWFRDSISLMAATLDEEFGMTGTSMSISGYSFAPVIGVEGKLTKIQWEIQETVSGSELWYTESDRQPMLIGEWPETDLQFYFRGERSNWLQSWPPEELATGVLPYRVKIEMSSADERRELYAAINLRRQGRYDYRDFVN